MFFNKWKEYDSSWLVKLAKEQYPDDISLHEELKKCTKIKSNIYFVDPRNPNCTGSEWQFDKSITLIHPEMDEIVLDIMKDGRVGSIEFLGLKLQGK